MKLPCVYCGKPYMMVERIDMFTRERVRETDDHDCSAWAPKPPLDPTPTDTSFIREGRNTPEGLNTYRTWLERQR